MSWQPAKQPVCTAGGGGITVVIDPRARDLGGFSVRRVLPSPLKRMVGPFIFFDHMGPAEFEPGNGINVRPHPHIGLATMTYLFEGEIMHRDSLGYEQPIRPGAVNWMIAGRGIAHSERTPAQLLDGPHALHGIQCWIALPAEHAETEPAFIHHPADSLPLIDKKGVRLHLLAGDLYGESSPVRTFSPMFYLACEMRKDASLELPDTVEERALYVVEGRITVFDESFNPGEMVVFEAGADVTIEAGTSAIIMLLGGDAFPEVPHLWWNFVAHTTEQLEQAKRDWRDGKFAMVPGDDEFIPLPED